MTEHEQFAEILRTKNQIPIQLDPSRTALIVVDMQRYFTQPAFPFTEVFEKLSPGACSGYLKRVREIVIPNIQRLLTCFRDTGSPIVFTAIGSEAEGKDLPCWQRSFDELGLSILGSRITPPVGDPSWDIDEAVKPESGEIVFNKRSAGAFTATGVEQHLRGRAVESIIVTGVSTDVCVSSTAREAADRNFNVVVVSDACTTLSEQLHQANVETLQIFGSVRNAEQVIDVMRASLRAV